MSRPPLRFVKRSRIPVPASELFAWHLRPGAFERLLAPGDGTRIAARSGRIEDDTMRVELSVPVVGPVRQRWKIRHEGYQPGRRFIDVMERGPFPYWRHEHLAEPIDDASSELVDSIEYRLPLGRLGEVGGRPIVLRRLEPMFEHRHAITTDDLASHARAGGVRRVAVRGAAAHPLGLQLVAFLLTGGHEVAADVTISDHDLPTELAGPHAVVELEPRVARVTVGPSVTVVPLKRRPDTSVDPRRILAAVVDVPD
ncbi:MAG: hypothetical protein JWM98_2145 [Thermoleophilia bacterium]|nr:hypothetical protein [Thermoleophilia bacterium]